MNNINSKPTNLAKVAISHDYFVQNGGAESVVESFLEIYPNADIYTSVYYPQNFTEATGNPLTQKAYLEGRIKTSKLNNVFINNNGKDRGTLKLFKHLFFLYPLSMQMITVENYDILIISSTYCGKNVKIKNVTTTLHYCHSPVRFLHGLITETDHSSLSAIQKIGTAILSPILKYQDLQAVKYLKSKNCIWIANSNFIKDTILKVYNEESYVIYPPVDINKYIKVVRKPIEEVIALDYYLCHGRISFHKRLDLAILACLKLGKKLIISGKSALDSDLNSLKALIPDNLSHQIEFRGRTTDRELEELISGAKAMIFPGKEDAGIAPIEMIAAGLPVIAFQAGGALEYVQDSINGLFFKDQSVDSLIDAINDYELILNNNTFDLQVMQDSVSKFSKQTFKTQIKQILDK